MTVSSTNTKKSYSGNGTLSVFAYDFKITAASELKVLTRLDSTGVETTETLNTGYIVDGVNNASGGNVTFKFNTGTPSDPNYSTTDFRPASGETVVIKRVLPLTQITDYTPNDPFPAEVHEAALDKLTNLHQQQQEEIDRSFKFAETDAGTASIPVASIRANKYLGFDTDGNVIAVEGTTSDITVSTYGATLVDDADASAARTTLGLGSVAVLNSISDNISNDSITNDMMANNSVGSAEIIDNSVTAAELNISGNGTAGQYVTSDGDGSFSYDTLVTVTTQNFTSSGTWTKPSGCTKIKVTVVGGGGGGGSINSGNASTESRWGSPGGGGAVSIRTIDVTSVSSVSVTVGAGGIGQLRDNGTAGGTSSFGSYATATGGGFGRAFYSGSTQGGVGQPGVGGKASDGDINVDGFETQPPYVSYISSGSSNVRNLRARPMAGGGNIIFGYQEYSTTDYINRDTAGTLLPENATANTGRGGTGAYQDNNNTDTTGGNGGSGIVMVEEYYYR